MDGREQDDDPVVFCAKHRGSAFHLVAAECKRCGRITNSDYERCGRCAAELGLCMACNQQDERVR